MKLANLIAGGLCDPSCSNLTSNYNESGTIMMPYPQPPVPNTPPGNFNLSIYDFYDKSKNIGDQIIVATNSTSDAVSYAEYPYQGYIFELVDVAVSTRNQHSINEPTEKTCSSTFSHECIESIIEFMNQTAMKMSRNPPGEKYGSLADACASFNFRDADKCKGAKWGGYKYGPLFHTTPNVTAGAEAASCANQPDTSPAGLIFKNKLSAPDFAAYNSHVFEVTPVIVASWIDASENGGVAWANTSMVCITPYTVTLGSHRKSDGGASWAAARIASGWLLDLVGMTVTGMELLS